MTIDARAVVPHPRATMADVARAAGVHVSTVSRVLRGSGQISVADATQVRIREAAKDLGYQPNVMARALRSSQAGAIGMLVPSLRNPVYGQIVRGAFEQAWAQDLVLLIAEDSGSNDAETAYERLVAAGRIDGLLVAGARPGSTLVEAEERTSVPFVYVNRRAPGRHNVSMRDEDASRLAVEHLVSLGHDHVGHVAGPQDLDTASRRAQAFRERTAALGVRSELAEAAFDERAGFEATLSLLDRPDRPSALYVSNFNQAIGALAAARSLGLDVPRDVSVITYDDDSISDFLSPRLTSVRMPLEELGSRAVDAVVARLAGADPQDVVVGTAPQLVLRESTAPPSP